MELLLTKDDCRNAAEFIEFWFFQNIREDEDMDNIDYVRSLLRVLDELNRASK